MEREIELWKEKLLDLGKRNNLVSFKDTKMGTLEILAPDMDKVYEKLSSLSLVSVYDTKEVEDNSLFDTETKKIDKQDFYNKFSSKLKAKEFLLYKETGNVKRILNKLLNNSSEIIEEKGLNLLYVSFGFINWKETGSNDIYRAPILLMPVKIILDSMQSTPYLQALDEDIIVNPTFQYRLKMFNGITLKDYDSTFGISYYIDSLAPLLESACFTVTKEMRLALFSFSKISMYYDLENNKDIINSNINLQKIAGIYNQTDNIDTTTNPEELEHNVVDADSSQSEAIHLAKKGVSFVLQGPPGTGKSQTITNLISEALFSGKKVLFVSEKQAALDVVYNNLARAGLQDFALSLYSDKMSKALFIEELYNTLAKGEVKIATSVETYKIDKEITEAKLDNYLSDLHKPIPSLGVSPLDIINILIKNKELPDTGLVFPNIKKYGSDYRDEATKVLEEISSVTCFGYDYRTSPFYGFNPLKNSLNSEKVLKNILNDFKTKTLDLLSTIRRINEETHLKITYYKDLHLYQEFVNIIDKFKFTSFINSKIDLSLLIDNSKIISDNIIEYKSLEKELNKKVNKEFLELDLNHFKTSLLNYPKLLKRLFNKDYKALKKEIKPYTKGSMSYKKLIKYLTIGERFNELTNLINEHDSFKEFYCYKGYDTDYKSLYTALNRVYEISKEIGFDYNLCESISFELINELMKKYSNEKQKLIPYLDKNYNISDLSIEDIYMKLSGLISEFDLFPKYNDLLLLIQKLDSLFLKEYLFKLFDLKIKKEDFKDVFLNEFYTAWIDVIYTISSLGDFDRDKHIKNIDLFKKYDKLLQEVSKAEITERLSKMRPNIDNQMSGSSVGILLREYNKQRRKKTIYGLMHEIPELILTLKPCFLMSPLAVSTYIDAKKVSFDITIFDEASQVFPEDAVGAIMRSKQIVVVGDSKQMPPSNFFNVIKDNEEAESDVADFESILDLCEAVLPEKRLLWHYRSRLEDLITFSNQNFYNNSLISFPSTYKRKQGFGVGFVFVNDGVFDHQSKTNMKEALKVVDLVYENIKAYPDRGIGVVAFSKTQQDLIQRLIEKRRIQEPLYEDYFKDKKKLFFIKNLETVQGDERDTIIFSISYGYDKDHLFGMRFGPLSVEGGERRLNVAITRAKLNLIVVSSIHGSDIDESRVSNLGPLMLKKYLIYAENSNSVTHDYSESKEELVLDIKNYLESVGYQTDSNVGDSKNKIDLAIKNESGDYYIAIITDGISYSFSESTRDRVRLKEEVLSRMGFKVYHVFTNEWFRHKDKEQKQLLDFITNLQNAIVTENPQTMPSIELASAIKDELFDNYHIDSMSMVNESNFNQKLNDIIEAEAPISEDSILKRLASVFGREKVTKYVKDKFNLMFSPFKGIKLEGGFYYTDISKSYALRIPHNGMKRNIEDISIYELANGLYALINENIKSPKQELYHLIGKNLGYKQISETCSTRLDEALKLLDGFIVIENDIISLAPETHKDIIKRH